MGLAVRTVAAIDRLLADQVLRKRMGEAASGYVRNKHDLKKNYHIVEDTLLGLVNRQNPQRRDF